MSRIDWRQLSGPHVSRRTLDATGRRHRRRRIRQPAGGSALLAVRASAARAVARQDQEPKTGGTLRVGFLISQIVTLDPQQLSQGVVAGSILPSIFSSLVQFDQELGLIPDLAETWEVSEDGTEYTFTLRPGLTFHNGDPLTSADFQYTYERTTNPDFASPHANKLALVDSFETPDEQTVALTLSAPFAPFLAVACTRGPGRALTPVPQRRGRRDGRRAVRHHPGRHRTLHGRAGECRDRQWASSWPPSTAGTAGARTSIRSRSS